MEPVVLDDALEDTSVMWVLARANVIAIIQHKQHSAIELGLHCVLKSDAKIQITKTTAYLIRIKYP